jgi:hypothetical protein
MQGWAGRGRGNWSKNKAAWFSIFQGRREAFLEKHEAFPCKSPSKSEDLYLPHIAGVFRVNNEFQ